eukprot:1708269-Pyramimonas_sp.AAC.1
MAVLVRLHHLSCLRLGVRTVALARLLVDLALLGLEDLLRRLVPQEEALGALPTVLVDAGGVAPRLASPRR